MAQYHSNDQLLLNTHHEKIYYKRFREGLFQYDTSMKRNGVGNAMSASSKICNHVDFGIRSATDFSGD